MALRQRETERRLGSGKQAGWELEYKEREREREVENVGSERQ
jgi:hypothetical protein